jgi:hypothetical protein
MAALMRLMRQTHHDHPILRGWWQRSSFIISSFLDPMYKSIFDAEA